MSDVQIQCDNCGAHHIRERHTDPKTGRSVSVVPQFCPSCGINLNQPRVGPTEPPPVHYRPPPIEVMYRNWKGVRRLRRLIPKAVVWGCTEWHPEHQFLLRALDVATNEERWFALRDCDFAQFAN